MPYVSTNGRSCLVAGCKNTEKARYLIRQTKCPIHKQLRKNCPCAKAFTLHKFPKDPLKRKVWIKNLNRADVNEDNARRSSCVICSNHFPDGQPTKQHPYPVLDMQDTHSEHETSSPNDLTSEIVENEVEHVLTKLCDIISENEEVETASEGDKSVRRPVTSSVDDLDDSLSARRRRRTIKKTYKARTFEAEKLFNRIRFGRPENRSNLLGLLQQTIGLPKLKECSVRLTKINVASTVKLSELDMDFVESNDLDLQISSARSITDEPRSLAKVVVKTEIEDEDLHEMDFEVEEEYDELHFIKSISRSGKPLVVHQVLTPPQKVFNVPVDEPIRKSKRSTTAASASKKKTPLKVKFIKSPVKKLPPVKPLKAPEKQQIAHARKSGKPRFLPKPKMIQTFKVTGSGAKKLSSKHATEVRIIKTYSKPETVKTPDHNPSSIEDRKEAPERENISVPSNTGNGGNAVSSKRKTSLQTSGKSFHSLPKIWTKLHTHYDYTEEEEEVAIPVAEEKSLPEGENVNVVYEEEEQSGSKTQEENKCLADRLEDEECVSHTGLSLIVYKGLYGILKECAPKYSTTVNMTARDQLLLVLMKLKMGLINADLASKFNASPATCGKVFTQWLKVMDETLGHMIVWQSHEYVLQNMPEHFKEHLPQTRCLLDVGQISIQLPTKEKPTDNKDTKVVKKFLYAVAPDGLVLFVSQLFDASALESVMFLESGLKDKLEKGDLILANKEFTDNVELPAGVLFDSLPHAKTEVADDPLAAESKAAVERLKVFRILRGVITVPLSSAVHVLHTCVALSNLGLIR